MRIVDESTEVDWSMDKLFEIQPSFMMMKLLIMFMAINGPFVCDTS